MFPEGLPQNENTKEGEPRRLAEFTDDEVRSSISENGIRFYGDYFNSWGEIAGELANPKSSSDFMMKTFSETYREIYTEETVKRMVDACDPTKIIELDELCREWNALSSKTHTAFKSFRERAREIIYRKSL